MKTSQRNSLASDFAQLLRSSRLAAGLSQEDLALEAGIDRTYVSMLERGLRLPTIATLLQIAPPLSVTAWELVRQLEEQAI